MRGCRLGTRAAPPLLERLSYASYGEHLSDKLVLDVLTHSSLSPRAEFPGDSEADFRPLRNDGLAKRTSRGDSRA